MPTDVRTTPSHWAQDARDTMVGELVSEIFLRRPQELRIVPTNEVGSGLPTWRVSVGDRTVTDPRLRTALVRLLGVIS